MTDRCTPGERCSNGQMCFRHKIATVQVSSRAMPSRQRPTHRSDKSRDAKDNSNAWERGVVTEEAPDGSRVPLLDETLQPIGLKQWVNEPKWRKAKQALDASRASDKG